MSVFDGNSVFVWKIKDCAGGYKSTSEEAHAYLNSVATTIKANYLPVKVANGVAVYNQLPLSNGLFDPYALLDVYFSAMEKHGKKKVGWHYIYGENPLSEAHLVIEMIERYGLDGYILDPEGEYKGRGASATIFMREIRKVLPDIPIALCSYRYPSYHADFPWKEFLNYMDAGRGDVHMPQVYWVGDFRDNAGEVQLQRSFKELKALKNLPVIPVGSCYGELYGLRYWDSTKAALTNFIEAADTLGCPGVSFWVLDNICQKEGYSPEGPYKTYKGWWEELMRAGWIFGNGTVVEPPPVVLSWEEALDAWARSQGYSGPRPAV